jgi:hypothetical protein
VCSLENLQPVNGFNKPKERLWQTLEMAGPRSILAFNLNKLMRDVVRADR